MIRHIIVFCFFSGWMGTAYAQQTQMSTPDTTGRKSRIDKAFQKKVDSIKSNPIVPKAKERIYHPDTNHSPHKAVMHALMIPGWGQIYNHQILKIPIIYTLLGGAVGIYINNQNFYSIHLAIAHDLEQGVSPKPGAKEYNLYYQYQSYGVSTQAIDDAVTGAKRDKELCIFAFVGFWGIQMIDAYVYAKFQHSYTMDSNLSFHVSPTIMNSPVYASNIAGNFIPGLKLTFDLR